MCYNRRKNNYRYSAPGIVYEKEEIKARKEKENEGRKRPREKKQETKLLEGENKKLKQWQKRKTKHPLRKEEESSPLKNIHKEHLD